MSRSLRILALGLAVFGTVAAATAATGDTYFVREGMLGAINPPITAIWDLQVEVMDDDGNFDAKLMDEAKWAALLEQARALDLAAKAMAAAPAYAATDPLGTLGDAPEGTDLDAIQARLAANPDGYRTLAQALAGNTTAMVAAAEARDTAALTQLVNDSQPVCKACHDVFWYPEENQPS